MPAALIETQALPGPSAVLSMADAPDMEPAIADREGIVAYRFLCFNDAALDFGLVRQPTLGDARRILDFYAEAKQTASRWFVAQCQAGVGRSQAVIAALQQIEGQDNSAILCEGTFNRRLYGLLLEAAGVEKPPEPLVSMVIRLKYPADRLQGFLLCMDRQRYPNWEVVAVSDGPLLFQPPSHPRLTVIATPEPKGRWGHPYRQLGIERARGEWLTLSNDDNYYVPGFIDQMLAAAERADADLAMCHMLHSHAGWRAVGAGLDLGGFVARGALVRRVGWGGVEFDSDRRFLDALRGAARSVAIVARPLFVHN